MPVMQLPAPVDMTESVFGPQRAPSGGSGMGFFDLGLSDVLGLGGDIFSAKAQKDQAKRQMEFDRERLGTANRTADFNYGNALADVENIKSLFGEGGQYANLLTNPIESSTSGSERSVSDTTATFRPEGEAAIADMLSSAMNERARADSQPEFVGLPEAWAREHAAQLGSLKTALGNKAAVRGGSGIDTELEGVLAGRGITSDYLGRKQQLPMMMEQSRQGKNQIANMLMSQVAGLTRGQHQEGSRKYNSTQKQGQGAAGIFGFLDRTRAPEKTVYV